MPAPDTVPRWHETQAFLCDIDHAVIGLMDPAHAAYVHDHWWWKRKARLKEKHYAPLPTGFVMTPHKPSKPAYSLLGDVTTEITFELPSTRFEIIKGRLFGKEFTVVGLTVCTPRDADHTDVIQVFYWPAWLSFIRPFFTILGPTFIADDRKIVELQREGLKFQPNLMLIQDADQPAIWYHRVKKAWADSLEIRRRIRQSCARTDTALEKLRLGANFRGCESGSTRLNGPLNLQFGRPRGAHWRGPFSREPPGPKGPG